MFQMLLNMWNGTKKHFAATEWVFFAGLLASLVAVFFGEVINPWPFYVSHEWLFHALPFVLLVFAFFCPIVRMAEARGAGASHYLAAWSLIGMVWLIVTLYVVFYDLGPYATNESQKNLLERLHTLPAIILPVWVAAIGWFLQVQAARKTQRTQHAFAFVMQTRTSTEFNARQRRLQTVYPPRAHIPKEDAEFFDTKALGQIPELEWAVKRETDEQKRAPHLLRIQKIEAIDSMKYMLNMYEFMAQGIKAKDLDEDLLYETVSYAVISLYERSKEMREFARSHQGGNQVLVFEHLEELVSRWRRRINEDERVAKDKNH